MSSIDTDDTANNLSDGMYLTGHTGVTRPLRSYPSNQPSPNSYNPMRSGAYTNRGGRYVGQNSRYYPSGFDYSSSDSQLISTPIGGTYSQGSSLLSTPVVTPQATPLGGSNMAAGLRYGNNKHQQSPFVHGRSWKNAAGNNISSSNMATPPTGCYPKVASKLTGRAGSVGGCALCGSSLVDRSIYGVVLIPCNHQFTNICQMCLKGRVGGAACRCPKCQGVISSAVQIKPTDLDLNKLSFDALNEIIKTRLNSLLDADGGTLTAPQTEEPQQTENVSEPIVAVVEDNGIAGKEDTTQNGDSSCNGNIELEALLTSLLAGQ